MTAVLDLDRRHPAYEWLGELPRHWQCVRLKHVAFIQSGVTLGKDLSGRTTISRPYLRVANVQDGFLDLAEIKEISVPPEDTARYELRPGDVLMTEGGDFDKLGRGYVWEGQIEGCLHQNHVFAVRPYPLNLDSHYLAHLMVSDHGKNYFTSTSQQTTNLATTNSTKLGDFLLPLPPLEEQREICTWLRFKTAQIDALIAKKQRQIELLDEKRQALISQVVTKGLNPTVPMKDSGIPWLGEIPAHWGLERLKYSITKIEQGWSPQCDSRPAEEDEWGVLKVGCVNGKEFSPEEQKALPIELEPIPAYEIKSNDILMSRGNTRELVGFVALVRDVRSRLMICDLLYRFRTRPNKAVPEFLVLSLRSPYVRHQIEGEAAGTSSSMKKIGQETIRELLICLPPIQEQDRVLGKLKPLLLETDKTIDLVMKQIEKLREYRQTLISVAVTGKIDVRAPNGGKS